MSVSIRITLGISVNSYGMCVSTMFLTDLTRMYNDLKSISYYKQAVEASAKLDISLPTFY